MRTIKVKAVWRLGSVVAQSPTAPLGKIGEGDYGVGCTYQITDIPDGVTDAEVVRLMGLCVVLPMRPDEERHTYQYSELGEGKILRP